MLLIFQFFPLNFYLFICPLLSTLILLFLYSFIFVLLLPSFYNKFNILSPILFLAFPHTKCSLSLNNEEENSNDCYSNKEEDSMLSKVLKPGPNCIVRPEKPRTSQFCGFFSFKNRSMGKKKGPTQIVVGPYGSENRGRFLRFGRFLFVSAFPVNFGQYTGMKL